jgi:tetratricopeptide (TPR) repeat protein
MLRTALPFLAALVLAVPPAAAAAEPTIEEMLREATKMAVKPGAPTPANPETPLADSDYVRAMKARLELELGRQAAECQRRGDNGGLGDIFYNVQQWEKAVEAYNTAVERNSPRDWRVQNGGVHLRMACTLFMMGKPEPAGKAIDEALTRAAERKDRWTYGYAEQAKKWGEKLPELQEEKKKLLEKAAADPKDANSRWKLLDMYRADVDHNGLQRKLDEFTGLMQFRELYPEDKRVADGECDWRLMDVFWNYGIRDEALRMSEKFLEKFPKHGACSPKSGDVLWRLAHYYEGLGRPTDELATLKELHDKWTESRFTAGGETSWKLGQVCEGLKAYREALGYYKEVRDNYKDHRANREDYRHEVPVIERIMSVTRALGGRP